MAVDCWRPSFSCRRCPHLERPAAPRHVRIISACVPKPSETHLFRRSFPLTFVQCLRSNSNRSFLLTLLTDTCVFLNKRRLTELMEERGCHNYRRPHCTHLLYISSNIGQSIGTTGFRSAAVAGLPPEAFWMGFPCPLRPRRSAEPAAAAGPALPPPPAAHRHGDPKTPRPRWICSLVCWRVAFPLNTHHSTHTLPN